MMVTRSGYLQLHGGVKDIFKQLHPYAVRGLVMQISVRNLTRSDVQQLFDTYYVLQQFNSQGLWVMSHLTR